MDGAAVGSAATGPGVPRAWGRYRPAASWFPGHMRKATLKVQELVKKCDLLIEVRDARVPESSVNPAIEALPIRKLVVYNKLDLSDAAVSERLLAREMEREREAAGDGTGGNHSGSTRTSTIFLSASSDVSPVIEWLLAEANNAKFKSAGSLVMVVGMPNVGKSTIINAVADLLLRKKKGVKSHRLSTSFSAAAAVWAEQTGPTTTTATTTTATGRKRPRDASSNAKQIARVGAQPGVTRQASSLLVCASPVVRLLDTPGIMIPKVSSAEVGLRLALTGAIKDSIIGEEVLVEYLLHLLQDHGLEDRLHHIASTSGGGGGKKKKKKKKKGGGTPTPAPPAAAVAAPLPPLPKVRDVDDLVDLVARASGGAGKHPEERTRRACAYVLAKWRAGDLGRYTLDHVK